jgi:DNA damage-inducible protein 1
MLYIEVTVNGKQMQAFVDSGAQSTILSKRAAEKCNLMRLLDTRFQGIAVGVGSAKILGRIHAAEMQVGDQFFTCSFTVLEDNKVDLLFGLDNLKRHQCNIDLVDHTLKLSNGATKVPFLAEKDIWRNFTDEIPEEESEKKDK